jgi:hypothetical protein
VSTSRDFSSMLNEYLTIDLMKEELIKRDYVFQKVDRDDGWKSGTIPVPFEGQHASSMSFGSLSADTNISKYKYVRGQLTTYRELWGSLRFEHRDLMEHDGKINEKSFLKILPGQVDDFVANFKMTAAINMLDGPHFATLTVDGTAGGVIEVDRVDRFTIDQEVHLIDGNSADTAFYVIAIDVNGGSLKKGAITLSASRGGAAASAAAFTVAQAAKVYHPGAATEGFTSLAQQLLSAANGGSATLFGQTKTAYPYLQAVQYDGSGISSAAAVLPTIFAAYTRRQQLAKSGKLPEVLLSYKHMGSVLTSLESTKQAFNVIPESRKTSVYGWQEVMIGSVSGDILKLVAVQEKSDDSIMLLDWDSITLYTNGFLQRRVAPDGLEYFQIRATSGFSYILDHVLAGDIVCKAPWKNLIIHSIPNY